MFVQEVPWPSVVAASAASISAVAATAALLWNTKVTRETLKANRAKFWLDLRKMFGDHEQVHLKLMPGQQWGAVKYKPNDSPGEVWVKPSDKGPANRAEWRLVEDYMGFFEHCERMLNDRLIDPDTFKAIYGYRLDNILWNRPIVQTKLQDPEIKRSYEKFIHLLKMLGKEPTVPSERRVS